MSSVSFPILFKPDFLPISPSLVLYLRLWVLLPHSSYLQFGESIFPVHFIRILTFLYFPHYILIFFGFIILFFVFFFLSPVFFSGSSLFLTFKSSIPFITLLREVKRVDIKLSQLKIFKMSFPVIVILLFICKLFAVAARTSLCLLYLFPVNLNDLY